MRPTFLGFYAATSGLSASQKALDIVGNNVANMHTEGYTRQRVDLISMSTSNMSSRYGVNNAVMSGQGVYITGVSQIRDPYLDARYREQSTALGELETVVSAYTDLENMFDDVTSSGLQDTMSAFLAQLQDMTGSTDAETAGTLQTAAKNIVQMLNSYNSKLDNLEQQNQVCLETSVQNVNSMLEKLASLNEQIKAACLYNTTLDPISGERRMLGPYGPNELYDDRNLLLDQLSAYGEVDAKTEGDGTITLTFCGTVVLKDNEYDSLSLTQNAGGENQLRWTYSGETFKGENGAVVAYMNLIEGKGEYSLAGQNDFEGIEYYREILDSFAQTFATSLNELNTIHQTDADGNLLYDGMGDPIYLGGDLFKTSDPLATSFTADNIRVSDAWINDPQFILESSNPTGNAGELDNSNIVRMINLFDDKSLVFASSTSSYTEFTGSFEGYLVHFQTKLGDQKDYYEGTFDSTTSVAKELLDMRDSISAVSDTEEAVDMMRFQKSYDAAARVITAIDEMLDTLINRMGRVGL